MSTAAIIQLVKLMRDSELGMKVRIEACETLLDYETRDDVAEFAMDFLQQVYEWEPDPAVNYTEADRWRLPTVSDKLKALKLTRRFESAKIRPETITRRDEPKRPNHEEVWRRLTEQAQHQRKRYEEQERFLHEYAPQIAALEEMGIKASWAEYKWLFTGEGPEFNRDSAMRLKERCEEEGIDLTNLTASNVVPFTPAKKTETLSG
jgi:hypothetical protein